MGASSFVNVGKGKSAREAFDALTNEAQYEYGHRGYTGTIAEKHDFVMVQLPKGVKPEDKEALNRFMDDCFENPKHPAYDKWGPACCVDLKDGTFLFFGNASS